MTNPLESLYASAAFIGNQYAHAVDTVVILGSGLGNFTQQFPDALQIAYADIPNFPKPTVEGHLGTLYLVQLSTGLHIALLQGRFHYYEGFEMETVLYPLRVMKQLGARRLIVTNAAGGINTQFRPGDLMVITDHINLMGMNPLRGPNFETLGPRFVDMTEAYDPSLQQVAFKQADNIGLSIQKGVYCAVSGPSYETPAEIRMLRSLGADAVGMSTVPEVIVANHMGLSVLGISCITNAAAGVLSGHRLSHEEVLETAVNVQNNFSHLMHGILTALP